MKAPRLAELQRQFKALIKKSDHGNVDFLSSEKDMEARLRIYRDDVVWRLLDSIERDFRGLVGYIGREEFQKLARRYIQRTPSHSWTLAEFSTYFPEFVLRETKNEIWTDIARWDWLKIKTKLGSPSQIFNLQQLQNIPAQAWPKAQFDLSVGAQISADKDSLEEKLFLGILRGKSLEELSNSLMAENVDPAQVTSLIALWVQEGLIEKVIFLDEKIP